MSKMTESRWSVMSNQQKYTYLKYGKKVLKTIMGIDADSKVNDHSGAQKYFYIEVGGVEISHKFKTEGEAYKDASDQIEKWNI